MQLIRAEKAFFIKIIFINFIIGLLLVAAKNIIQKLPKKDIYNGIIIVINKAIKKIILLLKYNKYKAKK